MKVDGGTGTETGPISDRKTVTDHRHLERTPMTGVDPIGVTITGIRQNLRQ